MTNIEDLANFQTDFFQPQPRPKRIISSFTVASLAGKDVPAIPYLVPDMVPSETVTLLYGDGGTNKTTLALQLGMATTAGRAWFGNIQPIRRGPALYVGCEDSKKVLEKRLVDIARGDVTPYKDFHIVSTAEDEEDSVLGAPKRGTDMLDWTPLYDAIAEKVDAIQPVLVILDTLADIFGGNENSRPQARQFVGKLRSLAIRRKMAVVVCGHPSASGMNAGTSGSTGWNNSVRSRLLLEFDRAEGRDDVPDLNVRHLRVRKQNYGPSGQEFRLRLWPWGLEIDGAQAAAKDPAMADEARARAEAAADAKFLELLALHETQGILLSNGVSSPYFAPKVFAIHIDAGGIRKDGFDRAMQRLFKAGKLANVPYGSPSDNRKRIIAWVEDGKDTAPCPSDPPSDR